MQKQLSATGLVTLFILTGLGILLTVRLQLTLGYLNDANNPLIPSPLLWVGEILAYITMLFVWIPRIAPLSIVSGMLGIFIMRLVIGSAAGVGYSFLSPGGDVELSIIHSLTDWLPRTSSIVFAILAFYPMRILLSSRPSTTKPTSQMQTPAVNTTGSEVSAKSKASQAKPESTFLFGVGGAAASAGGNGSSGKSGAQHGSINDDTPPLTLPEHLKDTYIEVPLAAISDQLPSGILKADIIETAQQTAMLVEVPLSTIAPQLKEAQVLVTAASLISFMPKSWLDATEIKGDEKVVLPLEKIIPQIPVELFELPPTTPFSWAVDMDNEEQILFARTGQEAS